MYRDERIETECKDSFYRELNLQMKGLLSVERDWLPNLANAAALLYYQMDQVNWAGFYLVRKGGLVLGPFGGKPACTRIQMGQGVCGTAAERRESQVVEDVHQFPGHIACDVASESEIVIPMLAGERLLGVLDVDSPIRARFDWEDERHLGAFAELLVEGSDWEGLDG